MGKCPMCGAMVDFFPNTTTKLVKLKPGDQFKIPGICGLWEVVRGNRSGWTSVRKQIKGMKIPRESFPSTLGVDVVEKV